jgi:Carboxypeptidase regulatory-like domain
MQAFRTFHHVAFPGGSAMRVRHLISSHLATLFLFMGVFALCASPMWAQSASTGSVLGSITDASGAVLPDTEVTLTDTSTNTARTTNTNPSGRYIFVDVLPGFYSISATKKGFATSKVEKQEVKVGVAVTINLSLQVGGASVVVEVQATGVELQTTNATVGNTISGDLVNYLPSLGRDVNTFISLQPGVATDGSVAGAVLDQSYFSLDGGNNSNDMDGAGGVYVPNLSVGDPTGGVAYQNQGVGGPSGVMPTPQDSVEEFKVDTAGQTADFNSSAGAEVKVATKRGTSAFHGSAYEYYKDNKWSANSYQNEVEGVPLPAYHYSRFGGAIGGPLIPKDVLGGKTYFFFNYEGFKWPNSEAYFRDVPSAALKLGLITDSVTGAVDYNLNPYSVTYNGVPYAANYGCSAAPGGVCDSRNPAPLGISPSVAQIWNTYMPASNSTSCALGLCDGANIQAFAADLSLPTTSRFAVARIDHDFSAKEHFMASYRYYHLNYATDDQVDIGGFFSGDTLGTPASVSSKPTRPWYLVAGLTSNITPNVTNDVHYSFLRNWWAYARKGPVPQLPGLGGALEIESGQSNTETLTPYAVNNQDVRTRFWDGKDNMLRDDLSYLKGNHLFQIGGQYQHNFNWHQRTDNGGTIDNLPVYDLGYGTTGSLLSADAYPCSVASTTVNNCGAVTAAVLGIVSASEVAYTRTGANLTLQPLGTPATAKSNIPYYNVYFSDTWHMKPTFTLTYGLGWTLEMPPVEENGQQVTLVGDSGQQISATSYLKQRKTAALAGNVYNPEVGFDLVGNTGNGQKYPYNPYYGEFSPRIAAAWNPRFDSDSFMGKLFGHQDTVIRGGYGRVYGRLNGVDLVLVPLLAPGIIQPVQCVNNLSNGTCGASGSAAVGNAFRIGPTSSGFDGLTAPLQLPTATTIAPTTTLPQPYFPGFNAGAAGPGEALDPNFRPNSSDAFDLTIQRQLNRKISLEVGYIGKVIRNEYQPVNLNGVPYMMTLGGQTFANAWQNVLLQYCGGLAGMAGGNCAASASAVTSQPFFEAAMAGTGYCAPGTCTATVVSNEAYTLGNDLMWNMWSDLDAGAGCPGGPGTCTVVNGSSGGAFNFPRSMMNTPILGAPLGGGGQTGSGIADNASIGHGNYNAGFVSVKMADWRGLTMQSNLTWAKALGTGAEVQATSEYTPDDSFNLNEMYGRQPFDRKITYNALLVYSPPFYKGQQGLIGRVLGGWTLSSVFTAGTGTPVEVFGVAGNGSPWGEGDDTNFFGDENAVPVGPIKSGKAYYNQPSGGLPVNIFANGAAAANSFRNPVIGIDTRDGAEGILNGLRFWNTDMSAAKSVKVAESINLTFQAVFQNVFNHNQFLDPVTLGLYSPSNFGALYNSSPFGTNSTPRNFQLAARVSF